MSRSQIALASLLLFLLFSSGLWWLWRELAPPPAKSAAQPLYTLRFGHNLPTDGALHAAALRFAEQIEENSGGRMRIQVFPEQKLGNDHQMLEMARAGELDMVLTPTAKLSPLVPAMQYVDLPFFFPDTETLYRMLDGEPGEMLLNKLQAIGLLGITFWGNGFKHFTANRPIRAPGDFQGLKVRIMKSRLLMEQFQCLGAHPQLIDFHSIYNALKDGAVDAQENPLVAIAGMKLYEVQSHLTLSSHAYLGYVFSFSEKSFTRLPSELQTLLVKTAKAITPFEREETKRREEDFLKTIRAAGMQVYELSEAERQAFAQTLAHLPAQFEPIIGVDVLSKTEELFRAPAAARDQELLIGLNADLSSGSARAGLAIKRGILLAIDEINQRGGVLGKKLVLRIRDHKAIPSIGINQIRAFSQMPNLVAVMSGIHSTVVLSELDVIHESKIPFLIPWAAATALTENGREPNYVFRVSIKDRYAGPFLVDYATRNYQKIALLLENSAWGRGNHESMSQALSNKGLQPMAVEWFNRGEQPTEYTNKLVHIQQAGAEAILLVANPVEGINIVNALANFSKKLPIIAHWGITSGDFWEQTRDNLQKVDLAVLQTFSFFDVSSAKTQEVIQKYLSRFGGEGPGDIFSPVGTVHAYDLTHLLALAIEQAGSADPAAIREALEHLPAYTGLIKTYNPAFTPQEHDALTPANYQMARYDIHGWIVPISQNQSP